MRRIHYSPTILALTAFVSLAVIPLAYILITSMLRPYETSRGTTDYKSPPIVSSATPTPSPTPSPVFPMQPDTVDENHPVGSSIETPDQILDASSVSDNQTDISTTQFPEFIVTRDPYNNSRVLFTKRAGLDIFHVELNTRTNGCYGRVSVINLSGRNYTDNQGRNIDVGYVESARAVSFNYPSCVADPTDDEQLMTFIERRLTELEK